MQREGAFSGITQQQEPGAQTPEMDTFLFLHWLKHTLSFPRVNWHLTNFFPAFHVSVFNALYCMSDLITGTTATDEFVIIIF